MCLVYIYVDVDVSVFACVKYVDMNMYMGM